MEQSKRDKRQVWFDQAVDHLYKQGRRSTGRLGYIDEYCLYRGDNGIKCAFGIFIPDPLYNPEMEGQDASTVINKWYLSDYFGHEEFFTALQSCHDGARHDKENNFSDPWVKEVGIAHRLQHLAKLYRLSAIKVEVCWPLEK